jgi:hypothetical protein
MNTATLKQSWRDRQVARASRKKLAQELAAFDSASDLIDLSAMLERYDDAEVADIRQLVDWTRAA